MCRMTGTARSRASTPACPRRPFGETGRGSRGPRCRACFVERAGLLVEPVRRQVEPTPSGLSVSLGVDGLPTGAYGSISSPCRMPTPTPVGGMTAPLSAAAGRGCQAPGHAERSQGRDRPSRKRLSFAQVTTSVARPVRALSGSASRGAASGQSAASVRPRSRPSAVGNSEAAAQLDRPLRGPASGADRQERGARPGRVGQSGVRNNSIGPGESVTADRRGRSLAAAQAVTASRSKPPPPTRGGHRRQRHDRRAHRSRASTPSTSGTDVAVARSRPRLPAPARLRAT